MAAAPELVDEAARQTLPAVPISLSKQLAAGVMTFAAMGLDRAYAGDPKAASVEEGERLIQRLAEMVVGEIREAFGLP
jgi:creatinine amidohydrolase/Fe(II)-dependent formamide hydrolase-like protein